MQPQVSDVCSRHQRTRHHRGRLPQEQSDAALVSVQVLVVWYPEDDDMSTSFHPFQWGRAAKDSFHISMASRTIVAAARGGQLKRLFVSAFAQPAFAARSMLPYWVRVEEWASTDYVHSGWLAAARQLRPFLSHLSRWSHIASVSNPRASRLLSPEDLHSLPEPAEIASSLADSVLATDRYYYDDLRTYYLSWMIQDGNVAQHVVDAWNTLVEKGEADRVRCECPRCPSDLVEVLEAAYSRAG